MLTTRDYDVIDFVKEFKVAPTSAIKLRFYPSLRVCQNRLKVITEKGLLNRTRDYVCNEYCYYSGKPKQFRHALEVSRFYSALCSVVQVKRFNVEPTYGNIRPDAAFVYQGPKGASIGLLEMELSNKGVDFGKYAKLMQDFKLYMTVKPTVFVVSRQPFQREGFVHIPLTYNAETLRRLMK